MLWLQHCHLPYGAKHLCPGTPKPAVAATSPSATAVAAIGATAQITPPSAGVFLLPCYRWNGLLQLSDWNKVRPRRCEWTHRPG